MCAAAAAAAAVFYHITCECCGMIARRVIRCVDIQYVRVWCVCALLCVPLLYVFDVTIFFEVKRGDIALLI